MMTAIMNELIDEKNSPIVEPDAGKPTATAKKTDVAEHPEVFCHVGLPFNRPPDRIRPAGLPFI
jgi:hypothetical protein